MLGLADAEADADRQRRLLAEPADVVDQLRRQLGPLAGDAGDRDVVQKPVDVSAIRTARSRGVVGVTS